MKVQRLSKRLNYSNEEDSSEYFSKETCMILMLKIYRQKRNRLSDAIEVTFKEGENRLILINSDTGEQTEFNKFYECCGSRYEEPEPRFFSFNNPFGACPVCQGFSKTIGIDMNLVIPNPNLSITDGAIAPWRTAKYSTHLNDLVKNAKAFKIPINIPFKRLTETQVDLVKKGFGTYLGIDGFF